MSATMQAVWNGKVLAQSDARSSWRATTTSRPRTSTRRFSPTSSEHTVCPWKGTASYYDVVVDGERNPARPGTTPSQSRPRPRSRTMSRSGAA